MKRYIILLLLFLPSLVVFADKRERLLKAKQHFKSHYTIYGFVRNYFTYDTRENLSGVGDLFHYLPKDNDWNQTEDEAQTYGIKREDLNAQGSFRFLSLTTRVGMDVHNYQYRQTEFGAKIEADFYTGLTGSTGVAQLRLRHAYMTMAWDSLRMHGQSQARVQLLLGQTWHPMAMDLPDVVSLNGSAPFGPFARSPQVKMDARLGNYITLTGAALWQMQYTSAGPDGPSANYIKYACTPEAYLGVSFHHKGWLVRAGADLLSISPRRTGEVMNMDNEPVRIKVKERITTVSPFIYMQFVYGDLAIKAKTIFAQAGEHFNLNGGYGVTRQNADGTWEYTPTRNSSTWLSIIYGKKVKGLIFAGYVRNFGTTKPVIDAEHIYFSKNSFANMNRMWRIAPALTWDIWKFQLAVEYELTSVQYGNGFNNDNSLADSNLHWVTNHRVQLMTKFSF